MELKAERWRAAIGDASSGIAGETWKDIVSQSTLSLGNIFDTIECCDVSYRALGDFYPLLRMADLSKEQRFGYLNGYHQLPMNTCATSSLLLMMHLSGSKHQCVQICARSRRGKGHI